LAHGPVAFLAAADPESTANLTETESLIRHARGTLVKAPPVFALVEPSPRTPLMTVVGASALLAAGLVKQLALQWRWPRSKGTQT